jgi:hypothetical protein
MEHCFMGQQYHSSVMWWLTMKLTGQALKSRVIHVEGADRRRETDAQRHIHSPAPPTFGPTLQV